MALIVEDGTGVVAAQTYATAVQARAYAALRGVALAAVPAAPAPDPVEIQLVLAMDYLQGKAFVGMAATSTQPLAWPRVMHPEWSLMLMGFGSFDPTTYILPQAILDAQCQLCIEQFNSIPLQPTTPGGIDGQFVLRSKVDVIETVYSERLGTLSQPTMPAVDVLLRPWVIKGGGSSSLRTVRV